MIIFDKKQQFNPFILIINYKYNSFKSFFATIFKNEDNVKYFHKR